MAKFDIILQNNGDKRIFLLSGMTNVSENQLYLDFENVELPDGAENGEYTYAVIANDLSGTVYDFKSEILETIVTASGVSVTLRDLKPLIGLLRVGNIEEKNVYQPKNNKTYYYKK